MADNPPAYREVQRFRQPLLWLFLIGMALVAFYGLVQQLFLGRPFGNNPAPDAALVVIVAVIGLGFPLFFYLLTLTTEVHRDGLYFRFFPLHLSFRKIAFADIARFEALTYRPIQEYGGWGIRYGRRGRAYNVSGNRGVQLTLANGRRLLFGSQHPAELAAAISSGKKRR